MTYSFTLTPGSNAVQLSSVLTTGDVPPSLPGKVLMLQADASNTGVLYIGGANQKAGTSSSAYGFRIEIPVTSIPAAPVVFEFNNGVVALDEFWIKAAVNTDKIHLFIKD